MVKWPGGKDFAFTVFDDTDWSTVENCREIYALLRDFGFRTTKSVWPLAPSRDADELYIGGATCADPEYLAWVRELRRDGFEIAYHNATCHSSPREECLRGLSVFEDLFGGPPRSMANHADCNDCVYAGPSRLTGVNKLAYNLITRFSRSGYFSGHEPGSPYFWGDALRERITYLRNFVFSEINCLKSCPAMPYHDPLRPYADQWFVSADGARLDAFMKTLSPANLERLAAEGGASIMYVHFGVFFPDGHPTSAFRDVLRRIGAMNGWFPTTSELLDHIRAERGEHVIGNRERARLERRWLVDRVLHGPN